jgi:IS1 family transposase
LHGLRAAHIQLDELRTKCKGNADAAWVWISMEAQSKVMLAIHIGERTQACAHALIHKTVQTLASSCIPVYTSDGLNHYFYALTAHHGCWSPVQHSGGRRSHEWVVDPRLIYAQVKKRYVRRKIREVIHTVLLGSAQRFRTALTAIGLTGNINTAFIERLNLSIRMSVSPLIRRSWSTVRTGEALRRRLELYRGVYHFTRPHRGLRFNLSKPVRREGARIPRRYGRQTPMMAAGITDRIWTVDQLLLRPIRKAPSALPLVR